jgi:phage terminase large subunit-like protein
MAGRGAGKTRGGAEDVKEFGLFNPNSRIAIGAPTFSDGRDICVEGESGLLNVLPRGSVRQWNRSIGELVLKNGAYYKIISAERPRQGRGPQWHRFWADEIAEWQYPETYDNVNMGVRLGRDARTIVTGTPKPVKLVRDIFHDPDTVVTSATTYDNLANLAPNFKKRVLKLDGTTLGQQEVQGILLDELPDAMWSRQLIDAHRTIAPPVLSDFDEICVAIDPQGAESEAELKKKKEDDLSETGIIVVGRIGEDYFVLSDVSGDYSPNTWALTAVRAYGSWQSDHLIAEKNQGGAMVKNTVRSVDPTVPIKTVHAKRGKVLRAEPVVNLYEQGRVHHVGVLGTLEAQMTAFTRTEAVLGSDRVDALCYAILKMMKREERTFYGKPLGSGF